MVECSTNSSLYLRTVVESTTETFICRSARTCFAPEAAPAAAHTLLSPLQDIQDAFKGLPHFEESGTEPSVHKYNELATLMHVSGAFSGRSSSCQAR